MLMLQNYPALPAAIGSLLVLIGLTVAGLLFYFLPALLARGKRHGSAILVFNFCLGWTLIGWVLALVWACMADKDEPR